MFKHWRMYLVYSAGHRKNSYLNDWFKIQCLSVMLKMTFTLNVTYTTKFKLKLKYTSFFWKVHIHNKTHWTELHFGQWVIITLSIHSYCYMGSSLMPIITTRYCVIIFFLLREKTNKQKTTKHKQQVLHLDKKINTATIW